MQPTPILAYHAHNIAGNDYATNDHIAFASDLRLINALGYTIVPLESIAAALISNATLPDKAIAITMDDGSNLDYYDQHYLHYGLQRSMFNLLQEFAAETPSERQPCLQITSFVIASPDARSDLQQKDLLLSHDWWLKAIQSGRMAISNHSWDHNHPSTRSAQARARQGTFTCIDTPELANLQIRQAYQFIQQQLPNHAAVRLFAYPYGETSPYLLHEYLPQGPQQTGTLAAFSTDPAHVSRGTNRWNIPRYVCGTHWKSPQDLEYLLRQH